MVDESSHDERVVREPVAGEYKRPGQVRPQTKVGIYSLPGGE